jgi:hypothetical protein
MTGNSNAFCRKAIGMAMAVTLEQGMGSEFAQVVAKLGEGVGLRGELVGREDGIMDPAGTPAAALRTAMEKDFHNAEHAGVLDLDTGTLVLPERRGRAKRWKRGKSMWTSRAWASNSTKRSVTAARV